ncbi:uncharacterized protein LOC119553399 isoform X2 [Drosophila subpulchrella]|nr:uncharacterized protein LOC119553399 isoform X2 [Drosophila subpulchrella]
MKGLNFVMALVIVELQIISTFALVAISWWADVLTFFAVAVILVAIFLTIGIFLPAKMDLTLDIAVLFIIAFIFLIVASFVLLFELLVWRAAPYAYLVVELSVTLTILVFIMYHAQTINGNRFAEMRLNDFYLGSLILFHDFLIIFWLTFYWQVFYRLITPDSWIVTSTPNKYNHTLNYTDGLYNKHTHADTQYDYTTEPPWTDPEPTWDTTGFTKKNKDKEYGFRSPTKSYPFDRRKPGNRDFAIDWSFYNLRPKNGFRTRGSSRTIGPEPDDVYHVDRKPDEWDPEYITQGADRDVPFDDRFGENSRHRPGESQDREHLPPNEDIGPRMEEADEDVNFDDSSIYSAGESSDKQHPTLEDDIEPRIEDDDAEGKSAAGHGNPTFDFPLADYQPYDIPSIDTTKKVYQSKGSPNIYIVPKAPPIGKHEYLSGAENPYLLSDDPLSNIQEQEKLKIFTRPAIELNLDFPLNEFTESEFKDDNFNFQGDEMKGQGFSSRRPYFNSENAPPWEELSNDPLSNTQEQEKLNIFTRPAIVFNLDSPLNEFTESEFKDDNFNFQGDEMKGQGFSSRKPNFNSENEPPWEELSKDEIIKLSRKQVLEDKDMYQTNQDRWVEPIVTREPYPMNLPDYEKFVMNGSASIVI